MINNRMTFSTNITTENVIWLTDIYCLTNYYDAKRSMLALLFLQMFALFYFALFCSLRHAEPSACRIILPGWIICLTLRLAIDTLNTYLSLPVR